MNICLIYMYAFSLIFVEPKRLFCQDGHLHFKDLPLASHVKGLLVVFLSSLKIGVHWIIFTDTSAYGIRSSSPLNHVWAWLDWQNAFLLILWNLSALRDLCQILTFVFIPIHGHFLFFSIHSRRNVLNRRSQWLDSLLLDLFVTLNIWFWCGLLLFPESSW